MDALIKELRRRQVANAPELCQSLGLNQTAFSRLIAKSGGQIATIGAARSTKYALRRSLRGTTEFPLFQVSDTGRVTQIGRACCLENGRWLAYDPIAGENRLFDGLPYFLSDIRPEGFMGRAFPLRHPELDLPERIMDWDDDACMVALTNGWMDAPGNLIVGNNSMQAHLANLIAPFVAIDESNVHVEYERMAELSLQGDPAGSSAGGEQPKFSATIESQGVVRQVLVKFSPADDSLVAERWRDLLVAEHLAGGVLGALSSESRIIESGNRIFLEVSRFDRSGMRGRIGVISLGALDDELYGRRDNWIAAADRLRLDKKLSSIDAETMRVLYAFGGLIANSDRHFGNISFLTGTRGLTLAPSYDQLPMLYAPSSGQLVDRQFQVELPNPSALQAWKTALPLAEDFWTRVADHSLISAAFRKTAKDNLALLEGRARPIAIALQGDNEIHGSKQ